MNISRTVALLLTLALVLPLALPAAAQIQVTISDPASSAPTDLQAIIVSNEPDNFTVHVPNVLKGATNIFPGFPTSDITTVEVVVFRILVDLDSSFSTGGHVKVIVGDSLTPYGPQAAVIPGIDVVVLAFYFHWNNSVGGGKGAGVWLAAYDQAGAKNLTKQLLDPTSVVVDYTDTDVTLTINASKLLAEYELLTGDTLELNPTFYVLRSPGSAPAYFAYVNVGYGEVASVFTRPHLRDGASHAGYTVPALGPVVADGDAGDWQTLLANAINDTFADTPNDYGIDLKLAVVAVNDTHLGVLVENVGDLNYKILDSADGLRADWVVQVQVTMPDGTKYQLDFSNRVMRVADVTGGDLKELAFIAAGNGYTLNSNLDSGVLELIVNKSLIPFTLNPGDTVDVTVVIFKNYVDFLTGTTTLVFKTNETIETSIQGAYAAIVEPGNPEITIGPVTFAINTTAPLHLNASIIKGYIPYPLNDTLPAPVYETIFFKVNDTAPIQWPIQVTYTAPVNVEEILYYVEGQGLQPLPTDTYTIQAGTPTTITITLNDTLYQQGDPLIVILGTPALIAGDLPADNHTSIAPILAIAALAALLIARKR